LKLITLGIMLASNLAAAKPPARPPIPVYIACALDRTGARIAARKALAGKANTRFAIIVKPKILEEETREPGLKSTTSIYVWAGTEDVINIVYIEKCEVSPSVVDEAERTGSGAVSRGTL
jgi:hypothetical protein